MPCSSHSAPGSSKTARFGGCAASLFRWSPASAAAPPRSSAGCPRRRLPGQRPLSIPMGERSYSRRQRRNTDGGSRLGAPRFVPKSANRRRLRRRELEALPTHGVKHELISLDNSRSSMWSRPDWDHTRRREQLNAARPTGIQASYGDISIPTRGRDLTDDARGGMRTADFRAAPRDRSFRNPQSASAPGVVSSELST